MQNKTNVFPTFNFFIIVLIAGIFLFSACSAKKYLFSRSDYAPIKLAYVDFKIPRGRTLNHWGDKIGNYNFELFGCTRKESKDVILDTGRVMQRNMRFFNTFFEGLNDYYSVIVSPENPYFIYSDTHKEPEYLIIAEITDLFLNVCDHYDWRIKNYKNLRSGSAEIKVFWKITDLTRQNIFWQNTSNGYADIVDPIINGETRLVEKAFGDALERMRHLNGFAETLAKKRPKDILLKEKALLASLDDKYLRIIRDRKINPDLELVDLKPKKHRIEGVDKSNLNDIVKESDSSIKADANLDDNKTTADKEKNLALNDNKIKELSENYKNPTNELQIKEKEKWLDLTADELSKKGFKADDGWVGDSQYSGIITIKKQPMFEEMNPYIMYRIRTGVVSVENDNKNIASGLLISPEILLTSDGVAAKTSELKINTINNHSYFAKTIRRNPLRDVALLSQEPSGFYPLPLRLNLPEIGEEVFFALGAPTYETGEGFLEDKGFVTGYRYMESGVEIMTNTYVQEKTLGGALIDKFGNILGMARGGIKKLEDDKDYFIPIADALQKLGVTIED